MYVLCLTQLAFWAYNPIDPSPPPPSPPHPDPLPPDPSPFCFYYFFIFLYSQHFHFFPFSNFFKGPIYNQRDLCSTKTT